MTNKVAPGSYQYDLLVATWHTIKDYPEHHNQERWSCRTSYCFAGWLAILDEGVFLGNGALSPRPGEIAYPYFPPGTVLDPVRNYTYIRDRVDNIFSGLQERDLGYLHEMFSPDKSLRSIQHHLTKLLGADPDHISPNEDLMLRGKFAAHKLTPPAHG